MSEGNANSCTRVVQTPLSIKRKGYGYFAGCIVSAMLPSIEAATFKTAKALGLDFRHLEKATCCPRVDWKIVDYDAWLTLGAYNLCLAEEQKVELVDSCNGCWITHYGVQEELRDPDKLNMVNVHLAKVDKKYRGTVMVRHWLEVMYEDVGLEQVKAHVKKPLNLEATRHLGCHARRLEKLPRYFDELIGTLGMELVDTALDKMCCGIFQFIADPDYSIYRMAKRKLDAVERCGADAFVVICSGCYDQFRRAIRILSREGVKYTTPLVPLQELMALAFGFKPENFGMAHEKPISVEPILRKLF